MSFAWQLSSSFDVCFVCGANFANLKYYRWCTNDEIRDTKLLEGKGKSWLVNKRTTEKGGAHISFQRFNIYSRAETKEDEPCPAREQFVIFSCDQVVSVGPLDKSSLSWILKWRTVNNVTVSWSLWNVFLLVILLRRWAAAEKMYIQNSSLDISTLGKNSLNISVIVFYAHGACLVSENSQDVIFQTFPKFTISKHFEGR